MTLICQVRPCALVPPRGFVVTRVRSSRFARAVVRPITPRGRSNMAMHSRHGYSYDEVWRDPMQRALEPVRAFEPQTRTILEEIPE